MRQRIPCELRACTVVRSEEGEVDTPDFTALASGVTMAFESAGATTMMSYFCVTKFSMASTCAAKSRSSFMPTALKLNLSALSAA
jgi:hypothetical protein